MDSTDQFEALVKTYYASLFRFAMTLTRSEADAQDLTQHTFYVWATKGYQLRDLSRVKSWLFTTLHRAFLEGMRRQVRFPHHNLEKVSEELPVLDSESAARVDSAQALTALARVDEVYQAAVSLFYLEDYSYQQIANILEVPIGTVKSRIARGLRQLKRILEPPAADVSSLPQGQIPPGPGDATSAPGSVFSASAHPAQAPPTDSAREYSAWDLSSTLLRELVSPF